MFLHIIAYLLDQVLAKVGIWKLVKAEEALYHEILKLYHKITFIPVFKKDLT